MGYHREIGLCANGLEITPSSDAGATDQEEQRLACDSSPDCLAGEILLDRGDFQIRIADGRGITESELLLDRMYSWRGYRCSTRNTPALDADEITLQVCRGPTVFGTLTIRFDSEYGLAADLLYRDEIDAYRHVGATVAELTRLAVDPKLGSKEVLGALFHLAYVCGGPLRNVGDVFIEVHPRHVPFYGRMLNFCPAGECKMSPRVEAPAVLLHVDVAYVGEQAALCGGHRPVANRSLYPYFCSAQEEAGAIQRMLALGWKETTADVAASARPEPHALVGPVHAEHAEGITV